MSIAAYLAKLSEGVNSSGILSTSKGGTGTTSGGAFPTITSISYGGDGNDTATDIAGGRTVTITGSNFVANARILINGVAAPVVSVVNENTITFTTPAMAAGTYVLYMVNADGGTAIAVPGISYSAVPIWSTAAGTVATVSETQPISASLGITSNSAITLSLLSGTLPPGAIFNSNGTISGTSQVTASPTTYTFTLRATDAELQDTDRQFSIVINPEVVIWSNPTDGGTVTAYTGLSNTINLNAIGSSGNAIASYSANTLPSGLTLAGSTITGSANTVGTSSTTLTATTANTNRTSQITFNWNVLVGGDTYWKNTNLLLSGTSTADASLTDYLILNNQLIPVGDTRATNFNPYQAGYYSNYFDGTGDYLTVPSNAAFAFGTGDFTIEGWFNFTGTIGTYQRPWWFGDDNDNLEINASVIRFGGAALTLITGNTAVTNTWYHIAYSRQSGSGRLFINGTQVGVTTASSYSSSSRTLTLMATSAGANPSTGYVSNFRVVKGTAVYTANFTPSTTPLTAITNTSLLTCRSARIVDNSANVFTITRAGDVSVQQFNPFGVPTGLNNVGSTYFDGTGDAAYIAGDGNVVNFGNGDYTIECWVYHTTLVNIMDTCPSGLATPTNRIQWTVNLDGSVTYITYQGTTTLIATAAGLAPPRQWNHVALVKSNNQTRIYVNGVQGGSTYADTLTMPSQANRPWIVGSGYSNSPEGSCYLSDYRITKGVAVYTTTFTPPTAPLTAVKGTQALLFQSQQPPNNSQFVDNSSAANIVTRFGNTTQGTFSPYGANWSNYFDGTGDYISVPDNVAFTMGAGNFTIECWVYLSSVAQQVFIGTCNAAGSQGSMSFTLGLNGTSFPQIGVGYAGTMYVSTFGTALKTNQWYHIAGVRNGATVNVYVDGVKGPDLNMAALAITDSTETVAIGRNGAGNFEYVTGYISNVRIVKGTAVYTANFTPPTTPLTAISGTSLLTCQDGRFVDNSTNNFTITRAGDVSVQRFSPYGAMIQTPVSYSAQFTATPDYLTTDVTAANSGFGNGNFTVEAWINPTSSTVGSNVTIVSSRYTYTTGTGNWGFYYLSNGTIYFNGSSNNSSTVAATIPINQWTHIAYTKSGTSGRFFVNGVQLGSTITDNNTYASVAGTVYIGRQSDGAGILQGCISNLRIVNGTALYTADFTPSTTPLTAVTNTALLTCQSTTFVDNSTNNSTITVNGNAKPSKLNPFGFTNTQGQAYTPALYGGSAYFDGTGDYLSSPTNANLLFGTGDFTIECWIYRTNTAFAGIVSFGTTTGNLRFFNNNGVPNFWEGSTQIGSGTAFDLNSWNHVVVQRSGTSLRFYTNGVSSAVITNSSNFNAGTLSIGGELTSNPLAGYITDLRITKGRALYSGNFVPPQTPVTASNNTALLLNMDKGALVDYTKSVNLETVADAKINNESAYNGSYYSNYFDGSGDSFSTPAALNTAMGVGFAGNIISIESWVFPQNHNFGAYDQILTGAYAAVSANGRWSIGLQKTANATTNLTFVWTTGTASQTGVTTTTFPITHGQWNHIAVTIDATTAASSTIKLFANGLLQNTFTAQDLSSQTAYYQPAYIGGCGSTTYTSEFHGYLSNFRILKGSLAYTGNYTVPTAPLTAITNTVLLTCQSNKLVDNSTNTFTLTRNGNVAISSLNPFQRNTKTSMYFDGTGDLLSIPINPVFGFGTGDFTVECWFNQTATVTTEYEIIETQTTNAFVIYKIGASGALSWRGYAAANDQTLLTHANIALNTWYHIAVSRASGVTKGFVNGVQVFSVADALNYAIPTVVTTVGGRNGGTLGFPGYIEDLRVTKGYARYTASFAPPTAKFSSN